MVLIYGFILALPVSVIVFFVNYYSMQRKQCVLWKQILSRCLFAFYMVMLFAVTFLGRADVEGFSFIPFSSYVEAWQKASLIAWRNIVINIIMFIPFGFLLPAIYKKADNLMGCFILSFVFSLGIELLQAFSNRGIFEIDDIINSIAGTLVGYAILKTIRGILLNSN